MFTGEFIIHRGKCVMCDLPKKKYIFEFTAHRDEDKNVTCLYELVESDVDNAACALCWRKLGRYIGSRFLYQSRNPVRMNQLAELLRTAPKQTLPTYKMAETIYGANDPTSLDKVMKLIKRLRNRGYYISHSWGGTYTLVSEPEEPAEFDDGWE